MENPTIPLPPPQTSSIFGSLNSWFTSTVLFILLNLMIATILFTSNLQNNNQQQQLNQDQQDEDDERKPKQLARSPSILHRIKSFNFLPQQPLTEDDVNVLDENEPLHVAATQYVFNQPIHYQHFDFDSENTHHVDKVFGRFQFDPTRDFDPNREEMGGVGKGESFDFDTTREENGDERFQFDPTREENDYSRFEFDPTREENDYARFEFDPTREVNDYERVDYDPTREEGGHTGYDFDPTHEDEQGDQFQSLDEVYSKLKGGGGGAHHDRTKSESEIRLKPTTKFKKSSSLKEGFSHLDEVNSVEARRPATVRERKTSAKVAADDDVEVDSKADDFINKFKNDLKLQRIESIMKSKNGKK